MKRRSLKMPVELKGVKETIRALRLVDPELLKSMNKEIKAVMIPLRDKARGYAPSPQPDNLYGWSKNATKTRVRPEFNTTGRVRLFPLYDHREVVKGIYYSQAPSKRNSNGFRALYFVANRSAAGSIYETAGRKNAGGDSASKSNNPGAGAHFINRMGPLYGDKQAERGRMIFRAWKEDGGKAQDAVINAITKTINAFNQGRFGSAA
jgi:hypothetical protein